MSNTSSLSWLDPQNLKQLAQAAGLSAHGPASRPIRSGGTGRAQTGRPIPAKTSMAARPAAVPAISSLKRVTEKSPQATREASVAERSGLPPFHPPQATMGARLSAFIDWLFRNLACVRVFIADGDGLPLAQRNSNIDLIGIATVLMDATRQLRGHLQLPPEGAIGMELGENETFQLLQIQTGWQQVSLGLIVRASLDKMTLDEVKQALRAALNEETHGAAEKSFGRGGGLKTGDNTVEHGKGSLEQVEGVARAAPEPG